MLVSCSRASLGEYRFLWETNLVGIGSGGIAGLGSKVLVSLLGLCVDSFPLLLVHLFFLANVQVHEKWC